MADIHEKVVGPIELAQAQKKGPTPPRKPTQEETQEGARLEREKLVKISSQRLLLVPDIIPGVQYDLSQLLTNGASAQARTKVHEELQVLVRDVEPLQILSREVDLSDRLKLALQKTVASLQELGKKWGEYKGGPAFPSWNLLNLSEGLAHRTQIRELKEILGKVLEHQKELQPYLRQWADEPAPAPAGPKDRKEVQGPVVA